MSEKSGGIFRRFFKMNFCIKNASFLNFLQNFKKRTVFSLVSIDFCRNC